VNGAVFASGLLSHLCASRRSNSKFICQLFVNFFRLPLFKLTGPPLFIAAVRGLFWSNYDELVF